ncbi:MAG: hypothetical protein ACR2QZ_14920 [Woeseiaceae bacterium]
MSMLCFAPATLNAEVSYEEDNVKVARLFADDTPLKVTIEAPLTTLMKERPDEEYLEGTISFTGDDGAVQTLELKLRTRGKYRRSDENCEFAPIRLNFRKKQVVDTVFAGQDKLKLVTHCRDSALYRQLVLREYLAYRLLNLMTGKSFGVRLLEIEYIDTEGAKPMTTVGFVIEDDDDVAARNGLVAIKTGDISMNDLDPGQQNLIHMFQYLIGNTDYSLYRSEPDDDCCHNSDLLSATEGAPYTPLPYDFDFAGLVNAPYAKPNPRYELMNVRVRLYRGLCKNNDLLPGTIQQFVDNKDAIFRTIDELEHLSSRSRRYVTRYLRAFFDHCSKPGSIERRFIEYCVESP